VRDPKEASKTFERIMENVRLKNPQARLDGVLVQNQLPRGVEVLVGSTVDNDFGPVVVFGLGGVFVEAFRDISYGLAPVSIEEALSMISNTKAVKLLEGVRGQRPVDLRRLAGMIMRASFLASEQPIAEMDLNPVIASADDCVAADARIRIKS
jgi:acyl-CoA synthetase (NDP forming)